MRLVRVGAASLAASPHRPVESTAFPLQTEDGLLHLMWAERDDAGLVELEAEEDAIVFPDEATFTQVRTPGAPMEQTRRARMGRAPALRWLAAKRHPSSPLPAAAAQIPNQRAAALKFANEADRNLFFW